MQQVLSSLIGPGLHSGLTLLDLTQLMNHLVAFLCVHSAGLQYAGIQIVTHLHSQVAASQHEANNLCIHIQLPHSWVPGHRDTSDVILKHYWNGHFLPKQRQYLLTIQLVHLNYLLFCTMYVAEKLQILLFPNQVDLSAVMRLHIHT